MLSTERAMMRTLEALDILTCCEIIIHASRARKASNRWLMFERLDYPDEDTEAWRKWVTVKLVDDEVKVGELPLDYGGSLEENYDAHKKEMKEADDEETRGGRRRQHGHTQ